MSLCDRCPAPGACCMAVHLSGRDGPYTVWDDENAEEQLAARNDQLSVFASVAVQETWIVPEGEPEAGRSYSTRVWGCTALDRATGRCTVYETRPDLCRSYEPASDGLCVFHGPMENGEESAL